MKELVMRLQNQTTNPEREPGTDSFSHTYKQYFSKSLIIYTRRVEGGLYLEFQLVLKVFKFFL